MTMQNYTRDGLSMVPTDAGGWYRVAEVAEHVDELNAEVMALAQQLEVAQKQNEVLRDKYDREVLGLNNEGDPIGGEPAGGLRADLKSVTKERDTLRDILKLLVPDLKAMARVATAMGNTARAQALNNICKGVDL